MRNAELDELQAGIKIGGRNIKNLRYADETTLMAETKGKLKNLLMKVKDKSEKYSENHGYVSRLIHRFQPLFPPKCRSRTSLSFFPSPYLCLLTIQASVQTWNALL